MYELVERRKQTQEKGGFNSIGLRENKSEEKEISKCHREIF